VIDVLFLMYSQDLRSARSNGPFVPDNGGFRLRQRGTFPSFTQDFSAKILCKRVISSALPEANRAGCPDRHLVWNRPRNACYSLLLGTSYAVVDPVRASTLPEAEAPMSGFVPA